MENYLEKELNEKIKNDLAVFNFLRSYTFDGMWYINLENQTDEWVSPEFWHTIGRNQDFNAPLTAIWEKIVHEEDVDYVRKFFKNIFMQKNSPYFSILIRYYHADGHIVFMLCKGLIIKNLSNNISRLLVLLLDVSESELKKLSNDKLSVFWSEVNQIAQIGAWEIEIFTGKTYWSSEIYEIAEVEKDFIHNLDISLSFFEPEDRERLLYAIYFAVENKTSLELTARLKTAKNNSKTVKISGKCISQNKTTVKLAGVMHDITLISEQQKIIHEQENFAKNILETMTDGFSLINAAGEQIDVNPAFCKMTGFDKHELIGKSAPHIYWYKPDYEHIMECWQDLEKNGKGEYEVRFCRKNGEVFFVLISVNSIKDQNGNFAYFYANVKDITARKIYEQNILYSEKKKELIIEGTNAGTWEWHIQRGEVIFNERWAGIIGYTLAELQPISLNTWSARVHPEDLVTANQKLKAAFERKTDFYQAEFRMKHKNGQWVWIASSGKIFERNANDEPLLMFGTHIDITDKKTAEEQLISLNKKLEKTHHIAQIGYWELDIIQNKHFWSEGLKEILEMPGEYEISTRMCIDAFKNGENRKLITEAIIDSFTHAAGFEHKLQIITATGREKWVRVKSEPVLRAGKCIKIFGTIQDIQKQYEYEELIKMQNEELLSTQEELKSNLEDLQNFQKKLCENTALTNKQNEVLKNFAGIVSHNFRSHAANISGLLGILESEFSEIAGNEFFDYLKEASAKLTESIENLSQIANVHLHKTLILNPLNLKKHLQDVVSTVKLAANEKNIRLEDALTGKEFVLAESSYLESILLNFLTNAIKYSDDKKDSFVKFSAISEDGFWKIYIEDNGIGIDLEKYGDKLFGMFNTFHGNADAHGVGLYLTKNQTESMGGKIEFISEVGSGSTFIVSLPCANNISW